MTNKEYLETKAFREYADAIRELVKRGTDTHRKLKLALGDRYNARWFQDAIDDIRLNLDEMSLYCFPARYIWVERTFRDPDNWDDYRLSMPRRKSKGQSSRGVGVRVGSSAA